MNQVREEDFQRIERWKTYGLLRPVNKEVLQGYCKDGLVLFICSDCDQSKDIIVNHLMEQMELTNRPHVMGLNGGVLLLEDDAPIPPEYAAPKIFRNHVLFGAGKKNIGPILLYSHYPCGMAAEANITIVATIKCSLSAVNRFVAEGVARRRIIPLFHVDRNGDKKRTYFVREADEKYLDYAPKI